MSGITYSINADGNFAQKMEEMSQRINKSKQSMNSLERDSLRFINAVMTPQERYNQQVRRLGELWEKGKISVEIYNRAVSKANEDFKKTQVINAELVQEQTKQVTLLDKIGGKITGQVAGWGAVAAAIAGARFALESYDKLATKAYGNANDAMPSMGKLAQISSSPEEFAGYLRAGREFERRGLTSRSEAMDTINALGNIGEMGSAGLLADLRRTEMVGNVGELLPGVKAVQTNVPGSPSLPQVLASALGAAGKNSLNLEPTLSYMPKVAVAAQPFGFNLQQIAALTSAGQTATGNAETGSTMIAAYFNEVLKKGSFKAGMSPMEVVAANQGLQLESEGRRGLAALSGRGAKNYEAAYADAVAASKNPEEYLRARSSIALTNEFMNARIREKQAEKHLDDVTDPEGTRKAGRGTGVSRAQARAWSEGRYEAWIGGEAASVATSRLPIGESAAYGLTAGAGDTVTFAMGGSALPVLRGMYNLMKRQRPQAPPLPSASP